MEKWKDIPGFEGSYKVSNTGKVKSLSRRVPVGGRAHAKDRAVPEIILKASLDNRGYRIVRLSGKYMKLHRAVMLAFVGPSELTVNHKDGNKLNNNLDNLEYLSFSDNAKHAHRNGLMINRAGPPSKLTRAMKLEIKRLRGIVSAEELGRMFNIHPGTCYRVWSKPL